MLKYSPDSIDTHPQQNTLKQRILDFGLTPKIRDRECAFVIENCEDFLLRLLHYISLAAPTKRARIL